MTMLHPFLGDYYTGNDELQFTANTSLRWPLTTTCLEVGDRAHNVVNATISEIRRQRPWQS